MRKASTDAFGPNEPGVEPWESRVVFEDWRSYYNHERPHLERKPGLRPPFEDWRSYYNVCQHVVELDRADIDCITLFQGQGLPNETSKRSAICCWSSFSSNRPAASI